MLDPCTAARALVEAADGGRSTMVREGCRGTGARTGPIDRSSASSPY
jgi:hypothetical protein